MRILVMALALCLWLVPASGLMAADEKSAPAAPAAAADAKHTHEGPGLVKRVYIAQGVFHPATVHFPVALLTIAAVFVVLRWIIPSISADVAFYCLVIGALTSVAASVMGFGFAAGRGYGSPLAGPADSDVFWHRWSGVILSAMAVVAAWFAIKARGQSSFRLATIWQVGTLACGGLVGLVGHQGGMLVYPDIDYFKVIMEAINPPPPPPEVTMPADNVTTKATVKIDFARQILPILQEKCVKCHGEEKQKGDLRMDTEADSLKGGGEGPAYVKGKGTESMMMKLIVTDDEDEKMPPPGKAPAVTQEEVTLLVEWINQGAVWNVASIPSPKPAAEKPAAEPAK